MRLRRRILAFKGLFAAAMGTLPLFAAPNQAMAQPPNKGPAYYVSEYEILDREGMKPYSAKVEATFKKYSGRYIVRGGSISTLEGEPRKGGIVVIAFDSMEKAKAWYESPEYQEIKPIRQKASRSYVYIVEGLPK